MWYSQNDGAYKIFSSGSIRILDGDTLQFRAMREGALTSTTVGVQARKASAVTIGGEGCDIVLHSGWNLVGLPYAFSLTSASELLAAHPFEYDATACAYVPCTELPAGGAVWLFRKGGDSSTIMLQGVPEYGTPAASGISLVAPEVMPTSATVWSFQAGTYWEVKKKDFRKGNGYLVQK